jgi:predicted porin
MRKSFLVRPTLIALSSLATLGGAHAADFKAGDWDLNVGGFINAYYTHTNCSGFNGFTGGTPLASQAVGCAGTSGRTVIGNGLLPNALITTAKTQQDGVDISATLMIGAAVSSDSAIANNNNVDIRQGFMTFGTADMGTIKLGRDYGLFGSNAILSDMTLLGAGAPVAATQRNRVTLGHIGAGYTYLGHYGQITYTTPSLGGGIKATVGLMSPVDAAPFIAKNQPQVQALLGGDITADGKWWVGYKHQAFTDQTTNTSFNMNGYEIGAKYTLGPVGLLANFQTGKGIGVLTDGDLGNTKQRNALVQATFMVTPKTKLGLSWGQSRVKDQTLTTDLKTNANLTGGAYYNLTKSLTLVGELSRTESKAFAGQKAKMNGIAAGAILFF